MPIAARLLDSVITQVNQYVSSSRSGSSTEASVVLGNIATSELAGGNNLNINDKIVVSVVNIEEEGSLKNKGMARIQGTQHISYPPPTYLNLYILFAANIKEYQFAIDFLFLIVEFFQSTKVFKLKNGLSAIPNSSNPDTLNN